MVSLAKLFTKFFSIPKYRLVAPKHYHLVRGDYGSDADIGVVTIKDDYGEVLDHWVLFPDGQLRKSYTRKPINKETFDMFVAFDMAPELKVSYRPISKRMEKNYADTGIVTILFIIILLGDGLLVLVLEQFFDNSHLLLKSQIGIWIQHVLWWGFGIMAAITSVLYVGNHRYCTNTKHDVSPLAWQINQDRQRRKNSDEGL